MQLCLSTSIVLCLVILSTARNLDGILERLIEIENKAHQSAVVLSGRQSHVAFAGAHKSCKSCSFDKKMVSRSMNSDTILLGRQREPWSPLNEVETDIHPRSNLLLPSTTAHLLEKLKQASMINSMLSDQRPEVTPDVSNKETAADNFPLVVAELLPSVSAPTSASACLRYLFIVLMVVAVVKSVWSLMHFWYCHLYHFIAEMKIASIDIQVKELIANGKPSDVVSKLERNFAFIVNFRGNNHVYTRNWRRLLATAHMSIGNLEFAEALLVSTLCMNEGIADDLTMAETLESLADIQLRMNKLDAAAASTSKARFIRSRNQSTTEQDQHYFRSIAEFTAEAEAACRSIRQQHLEKSNGTPANVHVVSPDSSSRNNSIAVISEKLSPSSERVASMIARIEEALLSHPFVMQLPGSEVAECSNRGSKVDVPVASTTPKQPADFNDLSSYSHCNKESPDTVAEAIASPGSDFGDISGHFDALEMAREENCL